jgi:hypothetical protein
LSDQISRLFGHAIWFSITVPILNHNVFAFDVAAFAQTLAKGVDAAWRPRPQNRQPKNPIREAFPWPRSIRYQQNKRSEEGKKTSSHLRSHNVTYGALPHVCSY